MESEAGMKELAEYRRRIDDLDLRILALLNERAQIVQQIGFIKQKLGMPIYEPQREDQVFRNVTEHNGGPLASEAVKHVFERIIDEMRNIQRPVTSDAGEHGQK